MIAIIGGGVFGLAIGWKLAKAGRRVTIFEKGQAGRGATWAAAGMLMPWKLSRSFSQELFDLQRESRRLWPQFASDLIDYANIDIDYQTNGRYFLALMDNAAQRLRRQFEFHRDIGFPVEWLSGDEVREREPYLGPKVVAANFTPMAHSVDNRRLVPALRQAFLRAGGILREQAGVSEILIDQNRVDGIRLAQETIRAETVILAAGAWSGQIAGIPPNLQGIVRPRKGQTLTLQMSPATPLIERPLLGPVYLVPRRDGRLIVGTTVEREAGFDTQPTAGGMFHILRKARNMVPSIDDFPILEIGAGLRPTGPDRLPVLGPTEVEGLVIATGGHSYGILLSPLVAQTICRFVLQEELPPLITPFVAK